MEHAQTDYDVRISLIENDIGISFSYFLPEVKLRRQLPSHNCHPDT